ncbi:MAG: glutathione S-transferase family protein [Labilithrix sp.]|nr:glutathione S-transferase family protein [Labilithrix sp.]MBX3220832.1 glutathione S-transferase family protein [Labilithrix sp.]
MKIFGNPMSTCTRKVLMTLAETNTPYELTVVDLSKREHKSDAHVRRQPFGRVPALEDDGFEMFESRAMCRYLNDKASGTLVPSDPKARALMEQWISVETSELSGNAMKFIYEYVMKRPQDPAVLEAARAGLETAASVMDAQLAKTPFLVGAELTLADICFMPYFDYAMATPAKEIFAKHPHVMAWWARVSDRATWRKATGKA